MRKIMRQWIWPVGMAALFALSVQLAAQPVEAPSHMQAYKWSSSAHNGQQGKTLLAESRRVAATGAPWLRLFFEKVNLGEQSFLIIKSLQDGASQRLDAASVQQWYNTSAYFNGDAVEVQIHVAPNDRGVSVKMKELMVGEWVGGVAPPESQCGPTDDRVPSNHPAAGRILSAGCSGWIANCASNNLHVTAGHCSGGSNHVLQFNVPPSNPNGTPNNPPPQDQYAINAATWQFVNGGFGNDWGIFQVFPNSVSGLLPAQAQGASFTLKQSLTPPTIRITGFGVDSNDPTRNQTQQTHAGPNAGSSGTTIRYLADTESANSGSPVIDDATGEAIGVHGSGGCTITGGGNNSGTSTLNTAFWNALNQCGGGGGCTNIALNRPASASSTNGSNTASRAVDGNTSTYWRSGGGGTQWLQVDLGTGTLSYSTWEILWASTRHATGYEIRVSNSSTFTTFTTVFSTTSGNGGTDTGNMTGAPRTERYVRVHMTVANASRYALAELKICSSTSSAPKASAGQGEITASTVPEQIALHANYPNPFNPSTNISFGLPEDAHVSLKVYNLIGAEVATLVNERRAAGTHTVVFDAANLPSGVYFSVLNVGEVRLVHRLVLMK